MKSQFAIIALLFSTISCLVAQDSPKSGTPLPGATLPPLPPALNVPKPAATNDAPYAPQPIMQGGVVIPLYPPDSPLLKQDRVREAEVYNMSKAVPGRIRSIV